MPRYVSEINKQRRYTSWALQVIAGKKTLGQIRRLFSDAQQYAAWVKDYYTPLATMRDELNKARQNNFRYAFMTLTKVMQSITNFVTEKNVAGIYDIVDQFNKAHGTSVWPELSVKVTPSKDRLLFSKAEMICYRIVRDRLKGIGLQAQAGESMFQITGELNIFYKNLNTLLKMPRATAILGVLAQFYAPTLLNRLLEDF